MICLLEMVRQERGSYLFVPRDSEALIRLQKDVPEDFRTEESAFIFLGFEFDAYTIASYFVRDGYSVMINDRVWSGPEDAKELFDLHG